jgi:hypothetical protein
VPFSVIFNPLREQTLVLQTAMTRGIHLKELKTTDLELLGLAEDPATAGAAGRQPARSSLLAEVDPALSRVVDEVRKGLEGTLQLLEEALGGPDTSARAARLPDERP